MNNPLSYSSLKLDLFSRNGDYLQSASGFVVEADNQYDLVTNWHVLSGREMPALSQPESGTEPYILKTALHIHGGQEENIFPFYTGIRKQITIPLYDDKGVPCWIAYQPNEQGEPTTDIALLPIQFDLTFANILNREIAGKTAMGYWNKISAIPVSTIDAQVEYGPADRVHIVGYPLNWAPAGSDKSGVAFWRTSWIASEIREPGMTRANVFFVDPCAPKGMTGAPVIGMKNDRLKLLGIYSDSSTAEFGADAGLVWEAWPVKELIAGL